MQCRKCKNEIPDGSIFCNWCGEKQLRERKKKTEIRVPEPRQLPSGRWTVQLRREGTSVTEDTKDLCIAKAQGEEYEIPALLALNSLRRSEICGLRWEDVDLKSGTIHIDGAMVPDETHKFVRKKTTKNVTSNRTIPIMIPALQAALEAHEEIGLVYSGSPNTICYFINKTCRSVGLPEVGVHGLRRSFASLCYHLGLREEETMAFGGWSNFTTVHEVYIKISESDRAAAADKIKGFFTNDFTNDI